MVRSCLSLLAPASSGEMSLGAERYDNERRDQHVAGVGLKILRSSFVALTLVAASGCASVQLSMTDDPAASSTSQQAERLELAAALEHLQSHPWDHGAESADGIVGVRFGAMGPGPKVKAESYLASMPSDAGQAAVTVRRDVDDTLSAAWRVVHVGKRASSALSPVRSDLRTVESAIVETRESRVVFAETMSLLSKRDGTVDRAEIRRMKEGFNQAILELGRTADLLSTRIKEKRAEAVAANAASAD